MKAAEWRSMLLYVGPAVISEFLEDGYYEHFMLSSTAIRIYLHPVIASNINSRMVEYEHKLILLFQKSMPKLYGQASQTFNVHIVQHLKKIVSLFGPMDNWSSFRFENALQVDLN